MEQTLSSAARQHPAEPADVTRTDHDDARAGHLGVDIHFGAYSVRHCTHLPIAVPPEPGVHLVTGPDNVAAVINSDPVVQGRFEELADKVLAGEVERSVGAVVGQLLNGARACARDGLAAREQEELVARLTALEEELETKTGNGGRRWRA